MDKYMIMEDIKFVLRAIMPFVVIGYSIAVPVILYKIHKTLKDFKKKNED